MISVTAFAPATVSNVACGFDVLGFALDEPGDEVTARLAPAGVSIAGIEGDGGRLPREAARNTAGVAVLALLTKIGDSRGVALTIRKGLPLILITKLIHTPCGYPSFTFSTERKRLQTEILLIRSIEAKK